MLTELFVIQHQLSHFTALQFRHSFGLGSEKFLRFSLQKLWDYRDRLVSRGPSSVDLCQRAYWMMSDHVRPCFSSFSSCLSVSLMSVSQCREVVRWDQTWWRITFHEGMYKVCLKVSLTSSSGLVLRLLCRRGWRTPRRLLAAQFYWKSFLR